MFSPSLKTSKPKLRSYADKLIQPGIFNNSTLKAKAHPQERFVVDSAPFGRLDFALNSTDAKTSRYKNTIRLTQRLPGVMILHRILVNIKLD